ncbi:MAG: molybdopterin converting factor subunit 1 [Paracoccaceae bacterium]
MIQVLYFAGLRERIGLSRETVETQAQTVAALIDQLAAMDEGHALAFADRAAIRAAVDQDLADPDTPITGAREVAFFPPMTGG